MESTFGVPVVGAMRPKPSSTLAGASVTGQPVLSSGQTAAPMAGRMEEAMPGAPLAGATVGLASSSMSLGPSTTGGPTLEELR